MISPELPVIGLFEFPPTGEGPMEARAVAILAALPTPADPLFAGYAAALIVAGRNVDRAEVNRDAGKVDRALTRWIDLLGKLRTDAHREGGDDGGPSEFDRYAAAVGASGNSGPGVGDSPQP